MTMDFLPRFPPDVPNPHAGRFQYSFNDMVASWLTFIMIPAALLTYSQNNSIPWSLVAFIIVPVYTVLQGAMSILKYRWNFRDAPLPITPAHGIVVVSPRDNANNETENNNDNDDQRESVAATCSCSCRAGQRWRRTLTNNDDHAATAVLKDAAHHHQPPLRLLVLGDSLAIGVGVRDSCTALLPEIVAKTLSKQMGGRAVSWTSHGKPGASAAWIVKELKKKKKKKRKQQQGQEQEPNNNNNKQLRRREVVHTDKKTVDCCKDMCSPDDAPCGVLLSETSFLSSSSSSSLASTTDEESSSSSGGLSSATSSTDDESSSSEGLLSCDSSMADNDDDDDDEHADDDDEHVETAEHDFPDWQRRCLSEQRNCFESSSSDNNNIGYDIVIVMTGANDLKSVAFPMLVGGEEADFRKEGLSFTHKLQRIVQELQDNNNNNNKTPPLIVFPGMPTGLLPIFRQLPLRWLAVPSMGIGENHKIRVAADQKNVMFVPSPTLEQAVDFEAQRGTLWDQRLKEDTLVALRDVTADACRAKSQALRDYYDRKTTTTHIHHQSSSSLLQANIPYPPLSKQSVGKNGSKIVSMDDIHPNDEGYDFWGRHIATGIMQQLSNCETSNELQQ